MYRATIEQVLDIIFPPSKRAREVKNFDVPDLAIAPVTRRENNIPITSLTSYDHPPVRECIRALKFDGSRNAAKLFADMLADFLLEEIADKQTFSPAQTITIIPVPLGKKRERERGFNQVTRVLDALQTRMPDISVRSDILIRTRETKPQMSLPREARLKNVHDAFAIKDPACDLPPNAQIIVVDDIVTTGATLAAACAPLKKRGYNIAALALARA